MGEKQQKYALISGASSGIGYQLAIALSKRGYKVFGGAPQKEVALMNPLKEKYGVHPFACDITKTEDLDKAAQLIQRETGGRLDVLYNNAGIALGAPAAEMDDAQVDRIFQINVIGHINMVKRMAAYVIAAKGKIVFTSSIAAIVPLSWISAYSGTKAAIDAYARTLHAEMRPFGVRVHSVITGGVNTAIADNALPWSNNYKFYNVDGMKESAQSTSSMSRDVNEEPEVYAAGIAAKLDAFFDPGFNIYKGRTARTMSYVARYAPLRLIEDGIARHFKQNTVFRNIRKQVQAKKLA